jgi:hypothetical protein
MILIKIGSTGDLGLDFGPHSTGVKHEMQRWKSVLRPTWLIEIMKRHLKFQVDAGVYKIS